MLASNKPGVVGGGKIPNICYKTNDPQVCAKTLEKAVHDYNEALKSKKNAKIFMLGKRPSPDTSVELSKRPKPNENTESILNQEDKENDQHYVKSPTKVPILKDAETQTLPEKDSLEITTNLILKLSQDMHQKMFESNDQQAKSYTKMKLENDEFNSNIQLIRAAKSINSLLKNPLMASFSLRPPSSEVSEQIKIPDEVLHHLDKTDASITTIDEDDEYLVIPQKRNHKEDKFFFQCLSCTQKTLGQVTSGIFYIEDPDYTVNNKGQERWFGNLKGNLIRHLSKLVHHQRLAVYNVMKMQIKNDIESIHKACSNILYFIMKTNMAWTLYPVLLATLYRSGLQVGNINHSTYTCEVFLPLIDDQLKKSSREWFDDQKSVTITADIGTIRGVEILVVLLVSEIDKVVKFVGADLVISKEGKNLANMILNILTSKDNLNLNYVDLVAKLSGIAADGVFCKDNAPFKNQMSLLFGNDFKFRWDILHLVNRAHIDALDKSKGPWGLKKVMDFIQNHSETYRSGIEYNKMMIGDIFGFKRPKLKSNTRMANYDFDQVLRFMENSKFFDIPEPILYTACMYLLICYVTKIILQAAQATDVSTTFIDSVFYKAKGKDVMLKSLKMGLRLVNAKEKNENAQDIIKEYKVTTSNPEKMLPVEDYLTNEVCSLIVKKENDILGFTREESRPTRSRNEEKFTNVGAKEILEKYVDNYWNGVKERLTHFDKDGTTSWSEAPSESIFSTLGYIVDHKPSLTYKHMISLCRVVKEGPPPGSTSALDTTKRALENWPAEDGIKFTTGNFIHGLTSSTVAKITKR